jgi:hypothetical protein
MREAALELTEDIGREISETHMVERSKSLAGMVALFVEVGASGEIRRYVWTRWSSGRRRGLLPSDQFVVNIGRKFMELGWR